jgi:hypothetical protein
MAKNKTEVEPLKAEDLDKCVGYAAGIVEELRDFLALHHAELIKCNMVIHGKGIAMDLPIAAQDPAYAGKIHQLKNACDAFCNCVRGNY